MADYDLSKDVLTRLRYYDNQLLRDQDFIDEQKYHIDRQRRHSRLLHLAGIAEGLGVTLGQDGKSVTVGAGTAVDAQGRQLILAAERTVSPPPSQEPQLQTLYVKYSEEGTGQGSGGATSDTRFDESPNLQAVAGTIPSEAIALAELEIAGGRITAVRTDKRVYSGVRIPGPGVGLDATGGAFGSIRYDQGIGENPCTLRIGIDANRDETITFSQSGADQLTIRDGMVGIGTSAPDAKLTISGDIISLLRVYKAPADLVFAVHGEGEGYIYLGGTTSIGDSGHRGNLSVHGHLSIQAASDATSSADILFKVDNAKGNKLLEVRNDGAMSLKGPVTVGAVEGQGVLRTSLLEGTMGDDPDTLFLNAASGKPVSVGYSTSPSSLEVYGPATIRGFSPADAPDISPFRVTDASGALLFEITKDGDMRLKGGTFPTEGELRAESIRRIGAPAAQLRSVCGVVNADGSATRQQGFTSSYEEPGLYTIAFTPGFAAPPAAVVSPISQLDSQERTAIVSIEAGALKIRTADAGGRAVQRAFSFIAMGS